MTVTIKCQHSNIEFEANSKRTKQHPQVAEFKNEAAGRGGDYRLACQALDKAAELGGYETVEQYMELVNDIYTGAYDAKKEAERRSRNWAAGAERERREAKARREAQNRHLREHGYTWQKDYADYDEYEEGEPSQWNLYSPDRRIVTVAQAMDEIERGVDVVLAELVEIIEADKELPYDVVLTGKLAEAADRKAAADEAAKQVEIDAWNKAVDEAKAGKVETKPFDYEGFETAYKKSEYVDGGGSIEYVIYTGKINGVDCAVVYHYFGGHDFYETKRFWCADPAEAGIEKMSETDNYHQRRARELFI